MGSNAPLRGVLALAMMPLVLVFGLGVPVPFTPLVLISYVAQVVLLANYAAAARPRVPPAIFLLAVAYGVSQCLSVVAGNRVTGIDFTLGDLVSTLAKPLSLILLVGLFASAQLSRASVDKLLAFTLYVSGLAVVFALLTTGGAWDVVLEGGSSYEISFRAFFGNRNQLGYFLFVAVLTNLLVRARSTGVRFLTLISILQGVGLLLTMSRGALLATAVLIAAHLLLRRGFSALAISLFASSLLLSLSDLRQVPALERIERLWVRPEAGLTGRDQIWEVGLDIWRESPIFGVGAFRSIQLGLNAGMGPAQFHSFYVERLASGGLIELGVITSLLLYGFVLCLRRVKQESQAAVFTAGYLALFVSLSFESIGFLSVGYVDTIFSIFFLALPIGLFRNTEFGSDQPSMPPDGRQTGTHFLRFG